MQVEHHIAALEQALAMTPYEDQRHGEQTMTAVTKMLLVLPAREAGELAATAKGEAYMAALEDVPSWAVEEAMRRWYRGDWGQDHDYKWQPAPATLRELAELVVWGVRGTRRKLRDLLEAEPLIEFAEDHCVAMQKRIKGLGLA